MNLNVAKLSIVFDRWQAQLKKIRQNSKLSFLTFWA